MSMTREEAIRALERVDGYVGIHYINGVKEAYIKPHLREAVKVALTALRPVSREQVEKVWRGKWEKHHKHRGGFRRVKGIDDMGEQHEVEIDERCEYDDLYCSECGKQSPDNFLNFCAYCGASMTDEAVEMVMERMERLEALNDAVD